MYNLLMTTDIEMKELTVAIGLAAGIFAAKLLGLTSILESGTSIGLPVAVAVGLMSFVFLKACTYSKKAKGSRKKLNELADVIYDISTLMVLVLTALAVLAASINILWQRTLSGDFYAYLGLGIVITLAYKKIILENKKKEKI